MNPLAPHQARSCPSTQIQEKASASRKAAAEDVVLIQRFVAGDETAFTAIVGRYRERMFGVALRLLRNHADTEEIVQDTFIRAHRGLATFRGDSSLVTWLQHIAVNLARNRFWNS